MKMRGKQFVLAVTTLAAIGGTAGATTVYTTGAGQYNKDTWNNTAYWSAGVPSGAVDAEIASGQAWAVTASVTPSYSGNLTIDASAQVGIIGNSANTLNALGTNDATGGTSSTISMGAGSNLIFRSTTATLHQSFVLTGDGATVQTGSSTQSSTIHYAGAFTGAYNIQLSGDGGGAAYLDASNGFSSVTVPYASYSYDQNFVLHANHAGSLGTGDVSINALNSLVIDAADGLADSGVLTLTGAGSSKVSGSKKLVMNASDTVGGLVVDGVVYGAGTYTSSNTTFIGGTGTLTVVPEPTSVALAGVAGLLLAGRRRRA